MTAMAFDRVDWADVARMLGGHIIRAHESSVLVSVPRKFNVAACRTILITDNCGEVNISELVPVLKPDRSVVLPQQGFSFPHEAVAHRLCCALYGFKTDYDFGRTRDGE